jgi:hypothetical protein
MFAQFQAGLLLDEERWASWRDQPGLRIGDTVEFAFWVPEESWGEGAEEWADDLIRSADLSPEDERLLIRKVGGAGRGAESLALILQIAEIGVTSAGAIVGVVEFGKLVRRVWKRLVRRGKSESGTYALPMLSLQTTVLLVIADLSARLGDLDGYRLVWAGDVGGGLMCDLGHSGQDVFLTLISNGREWHLYLTDSVGQILHRASGDQSRAPYGPTDLLETPEGPRPGLPELLAGVDEEIEAESE